MSSFTHIDSQGRVRMVDVSDKPPTLRTAVAQGTITMKPETFAMIYNQTAQKGNVLETARRLPELPVLGARFFQRLGILANCIAQRCLAREQPVDFGKSVCIPKFTKVIDRQLPGQG